MIGAIGGSGWGLPAVIRLSSSSINPSGAGLNPHPTTWWPPNTSAPRHQQHPKHPGPKRYGADAARWEKVDENMSLREVLTRPGHVIPGVPLFWVVAKGTEYRRRFLEKGER